ncbi:hypothetical protein VI03_08590 [Burkholderia vietnamiensis]|nr:hypothetical protein VI03_08590 [Burkholderia vietnamiensis]KVF25185.1 hypothetical protein WJ07_12160 [Burkholderia vietnamiensis]TPQ36195.1 hypothetical protein C2U71_26560 [Burkholderia ubonensis]
MCEVLEESELPAVGESALRGKTVGEVVKYIAQALQAAGLEPESVHAANVSPSLHGTFFGARDSSYWPIGSQSRRRSSVSVRRDRSEGWRVSIDTVWFQDDGDGGHMRTQPLVIIRTMTRSDGWAVAAVVSNLLDIA